MHSRSSAVLLALATALALLTPAPSAAAACTVHGAIGQYWHSIGADRSFLGACTTDEVAVPGGVVQHFSGGSVYWSASTGAREVHGSIRVTYQRAGGPSSLLRLPVTHETRTPTRTGAYNHFQGGSVYWSPGTGAHVVHGSIRQAWASSGWENGVLGFPVTSELPTPVKAGAFNHFERGSVYWSPRTGAHLVHGGIRAAWAAAGWEASGLGFPVSSEYAVPGGRRSDFEGGSILWDAATGRTRTVAGPRPAFAYAVGTPTAGDLPSSYRAGCPVAPAQLRLLRLSHVGFDGVERTGELVVHEGQVVPVLRAFEQLHLIRFPVQRMQRVDAFGGSDAASMDANNTSAFNCRRVAGSTAWSEHAWGTALDVNPVQNPYVSGSTVSPAAGRAYLDRGHVRPGMVVPGPVVDAFARQGWRWGGFWVNSKDYQHFSVSGR